MTYTESNQSYVSSILKPYFKESGIEIDENRLNKIVDQIIKDDGFKDINAENGHDYILQKGLSLLDDNK